MPKKQAGTEETGIDNAYKIETMGILNKQSEKILQYDKPGNYGGFLRMDVAPYTIGKIVKIEDQDAATDFYGKPLQYFIGKVTGFNIFIVHAGFFKTPDHIVKDWEIEKDINEMCRWYFKNKVEGKKTIQKLYKSQNNQSWEQSH